MAHPLTPEITADAPGEQPIMLPPLREDLKLLPGPASPEGWPSWTLYDSARHRFFRIGWLEFELISRWHMGYSSAVASSIAAETTIRATEADILEFLNFLHHAGLLAPVGQANSKRLVEEEKAMRSNPTQWLLKNYIFFRIRLCNPDRLLTRMHTALSWMFTARFSIVLVMLGILGLALIFRQWEAYTHSFVTLFSLEGMVKVAIALGFAKIAHELGHGLMAKHYGCRVPSMGTAFIVMCPVLWTDTTDAWRLTNRHQRIAIDAAGMLAEIILAIAASLAWCLLDDGPMRTAAFLLSSSTWLLTVVVNVNPLMRFDGYYLLSDILDIPNLQDRAFALCRWKMREILFGLGEAAPERFNSRTCAILLIYGFSCWVYRFFLFMGIALLVYHFTFKALGILLMFIEIWWFIAKPIMREVGIWRERVKGSGWNAARLRVVMVCIAVFLAAVIPWHSRISAPAMFRAERQAVIYTAESGRLVRIVGNAGQVQEGDSLATLESPDIAYHLAMANNEVSGLKAQLAGQSFDPAGLATSEASWRELDEALARKQEVEAEAAALEVRAPFAGIMTDVPVSLHVGAWLPRREPLGILIDPASQLVEAYINEKDLARIAPGDTALFIPDNGEISVALTVATISHAAITDFTLPELTSPHGGSIVVRKEQNGRTVPDTAIYRVLLTPRKALPTIFRQQRGTVEIAGVRISPIARLYQRVAALLIRETGF
jgi:putative peptide zinc metalloprotease protein